ncbi:orotate phosphoribosyltransferase [uncultured Cohaesibacter sp.]|uniref:orotate phosphoribosyltransferase n=1 Tax=uncultured Cohaesibacter sp. TaxID=1002546 RepID=UPI0029308054|nr:orotate phosphoribosyltransferase [uncultured Cohaesibacter sp.]
MITSSFPDRALMAEMTAKMLLEVGAVHFRTDEPFKLASGIASPTYIDCRKLISYPRIRNSLMEFCAATIMRDIGFESIDVVVGGETAGIPFAAWIADKLALPMNYVRKKPKGYGRDAQIEGAPIAGKRALLVEDLTTDGGSKINFVQAMRKAEAEVKDTIVLFYYDIFPEALENMKKIDLNLHYLATWRDVLEVSKANGYFDTKTLDGVESFLNDPLAWSGAHGGATDITPVS